MKPSVSILIPCFNAGRYLAATLDSALAQTLPADEIIVVDDGSTDNSREIAANYAPRVTLLTNPGKGASAARNHATRSSRGEFLQYLDADDLLEPGALAARVHMLAEGCDIVISDWRRLHEKDGAWLPGPVIESGRLPDASSAPKDLDVFRGFWAPPAAILYRRELCERIGGWRENLPVIQDARFLLDGAYAGARFGHAPGVGALYRQHAHGSLSTQSQARFWRDVLVNALEVETRWELDGRLDDAHRDALARCYGLGARMGFVFDSSVYADNRRQLRRFPAHPPSRFLRAAYLLSDIFGYPIARRLLGRFCARHT